MSSASRPEKCPLCGKPASQAHRPFCGQGCRDRDLLKWLGEGYRVPGQPADPEDFAGPSDGVDSDA